MPKLLGTPLWELDRTGALAGDASPMEAGQGVKRARRCLGISLQQRDPPQSLPLASGIQQAMGRAPIALTRPGQVVKEGTHSRLRHLRLRPTSGLKGWLQGLRLSRP